VIDRHSYSVYALKLPEMKSKAGEANYAVKPVVVRRHRGGQWRLSNEVRVGDHGGWDSLEEAKKAVRSFLNSKVAKLHNIVVVTIVKLVVNVESVLVEQVRKSTAPVVDVIAQTDLEQVATGDLSPYSTGSV
jgi:hypothetical protein